MPGPPSFLLPRTPKLGRLSELHYFILLLLWDVLIPAELLLVALLGGVRGLEGLVMDSGGALGLAVLLPTPLVGVEIPVLGESCSIS